MSSQDLFQAKFRVYWIAILLMSFITMMFVGNSAYRVFIHEYRTAELETRNLSLAVERETRETISRINLTLIRANDVFLISEPKKMGYENLSRYLYEIKKMLPNVDIIVATDENGNQIGNTRWLKNYGQDFTYQALSNADRAYFQRHKNEPETELVISDPVISKSSGNLILTIGRKLPFKNNKFQGVIFVTLNLQAFSDYFNKISQDELFSNNSISMFNMDQVLLARFPFNQAQIGKQFPIGTTIINKIKAGELSGFFSRKSPLDGIKRIYSYRAISGFPLLVVAGKDEESIFNNWLSQEGPAIFLVILFISLLITGLIFYLKKLVETESQKELAQQSSKMSIIGEMVTGIAEEIMSPVAIIKIHSEALASKLDAGNIDIDRIKNTNRKIDNMCLRIEKIIRGLKSYSRDSSLDPKQLTTFLSIIDTAIELTSLRYKNSSIDLKAHTIPDVMVFCRETQISQVIINLLNNAADAVLGQKNKWVELEYTLLDNRLQIIITDSGPEITQEVAEKMMNPFFTTKVGSSGTGIGLSIAKEIIQDHGGTIFLDRSFKNTRFIIELNIEKNH